MDFDKVLINFLLKNNKGFFFIYLIDLKNNTRKKLRNKN